MRIKSFLYPIGLSIIIMILLMFFIYDFRISLMNISNVIFLMGVFFFFPGLISTTGASQVFDSSLYLTRKTFAKNSENDFKTFNDYKEYKRLKRANAPIKSRGSTILILGGVYIIISLIIGFII